MHRSHPDDNFTILPNDALQDDRLSLAARGLLVSLISRPADWQTNADTLSRQAKQRRGARVGEGRRGMRAVFAELERYGYLVRTTTKGEGGLFVTTMDLYDTPGHGPVEGTAHGTSETGTSDPGTSVSGTPLQSTDQQRNDQQSSEHEDSPALAAARAAAAAARENIQAKLQRLDQAIRDLGDTDLRNFMLKFEDRRPLIYRQCRQKADTWLKKEHPALLKAAARARTMDQVTYMFALRHYEPEPPEKTEWDAWVVRPLESDRQDVAA